MVLTTFRPILTVVLLLLFAGLALATCNDSPSPEDARVFAIQDGRNSIVKAILVGLIVTMYLVNVGRYVQRKRRWVLPVVLSLLSLPILFSFWLAEIISSECGSGGLNPWYYLVPLGALAFLWLLQAHFYDAQQPPPSIITCD
jgi:hypothetical protein